MKKYIAIVYMKERVRVCCVDTPEHLVLRTLSKKPLSVVETIWQRSGGWDEKNKSKSNTTYAPAS